MKLAGGGQMEGTPFLSNNCYTESYCYYGIDMQGDI